MLLILERLYLFSKIVRQSLLFSVFGVVSKCKHKPTCGAYFLKILRSEGIFAALYKGIPRIITCY